MNKRAAIAWTIFVKTPEFSEVKTRLAATVGREKALAAYEAGVRQMKDLALELTRLEGPRLPVVPIWAVAEEEARRHPRWQDFRTVSQGTGTLGQRLGFVHRQLSAEFEGVVFLGADCPVLTPKVCLNALDRMFEADQHVLGPTEDGGYYLFASRLDVRPEIWLEVPYSCEKTATVFTELLSRDHPVFWMEPLFDIDTEEDLKRYEASVHSESTPPHELPAPAVQPKQ